MNATLREIWRFPIKSHGRESLASASLTVGQCLPYDREWAVAHEASEADGRTWVPCANFSRGSKAPALAAITSHLDETTGQITLSHPDRADLTFDPDREGDKLIAWSKGLVPESRAQSARVIRGRQHGFSDSDFPSITLCNRASHSAIEEKLGQPISIHRWRGNLWFDGLSPWEEFDWMDRDLRIGAAILRVRERTDRCMATHNNPDTGLRDVNTLSVLDRFGHRDFSVRAEVIKAGAITVGDKLELI